MTSTGKKKEINQPPNVAVLMSTYNPQPHLDIQIKTILEQQNVNITLFIRDDGSTEKNNILNRHLNNTRVKISTSKNIGPARSFLELLINTPSRYDYYALSDQDDIWLTEKIDRACKQLDTDTRPAIYCSALTIFDDATGKESFHCINKKFTTLNYELFHNYVTGNTIVLNSLAFENIKAYCAPNSIYMHDWWIGIIAGSLGWNTQYDPTSQIKYRQHNNNHFGYNIHFFTYKNFTKLLSLKSEYILIFQQLKSLLAYNAHWQDPYMQAQISKLIRNNRSIRHRIINVFSGTIKSRSASRTLFLMLIYLIWGGLI